MKNRSAACARAIAAGGGVIRLARKLDISPSAVSQWPRVPPGRVAEVHQITGIACDELLEIRVFETIRVSGVVEASP